MVIYSLTQHFRLPRLSRMCSYCTIGAPASTPPNSRQPAASPRTRPLRNRNTEDDRERSRLLRAGTEIGMKRARRRYAGGLRGRGERIRTSGLSVPNAAR